jgi:hypothetical protein
MYDLIASRMLAGGPLADLHDQDRVHVLRDTDLGPSAERAARRRSPAFSRWFRAARPVDPTPCQTHACLAC